jgi:hypothetical protein
LEKELLITTPLQALPESDKTSTENLSPSDERPDGKKEEVDLLRVNLTRLIYSQLRGTSFGVFIKGIKLLSDDRKHTSCPDLCVSSHSPQFYKQRPDILTNAKVIFKINHRKTDPFHDFHAIASYHPIESLTDYLIIDPGLKNVTYFERLSEGEWRKRVVNGRQAPIKMTSITCSLNLAQLFEPLSSSQIA